MNLKKSDVYKYVFTLMATHPDHCAAHKIAVRETKGFYPASEYECADAIAKEHFPNCEMLDINQCLAEHNAVENLQKSIQNMHKNIALTTNKNQKLRLSAEIIRSPYNSRINDAITAGEKYMLIVMMHRIILTR